MYLSISKCIRLGKEIGHQFIMITHSFPYKRCIVVSILIFKRHLKKYNVNKNIGSQMY